MRREERGKWGIKDQVREGWGTGIKNRREERRKERGAGEGHY